MEHGIYSINGPVVTVKDSQEFSMMEMVYVGDAQLLSEVIRVEENKTIIQVYESTTGLTIGEKVVGSGGLLSATLGPGILKNIFDGIERPLKNIAAAQGAFIQEGKSIPSLNEEVLWSVTMDVVLGQKVSSGDIFARVQETDLIEHRSMIPNGVRGEIISVKPSGFYTVTDILCVVRQEDGTEVEVKLAQKWPIRMPRPVKDRKSLTMPLVTGQRVIDTLFPIAKGGAAAVPGGFGAGKTMTQHQLAKWCDADIIVYVGCGERGNEMTQVLEEFSELIDPKSNRPLLDRTVLIANTSNMPVAAREASIYTGITLAEYYRDMGYHVAIMADSTSRWAEALREISGRLEEMPAEEGFPAYLPSRIAQFYERAGMVENCNGTTGSVTIIGAVSPQGADFSEPVTQNTKRFVRCFWALDKSLAYARHYPAINWNSSYSEYVDDLKKWYDTNVSRDFINYRQQVVGLLHEEYQLMEIVKLIGADVLPDDQKLIIEIAKVIRLGFLQQNAYSPDDTFVPFEKQRLMLKVILHLFEACKPVIARKIPMSSILATGIFDDVIKMKVDVTNDQLDKLNDYIDMIDKKLSMIE